MLQELAARSGATAWAIASMLFFLAVYLVIAVRVFRTRPEDLDARARLALEGDETPGLTTGAPTPVTTTSARRHRSAGPSGPAGE
jgi:hypothetical protein